MNGNNIRIGGVLFYKYLELKTDVNTIDHLMEKMLVDPTLKFTKVRDLNDPNEFKYFIGFDLRDKESIYKQWIQSHSIGTESDFNKWISSVDDKGLLDLEWKHCVKCRYELRIA